jgi:uncharacterized protein
MEIKTYFFDNKGDINVILGMSHFIKTVDDLAEIMNTSTSGAKYGIAFSEASGEALIRHEGNDKELVDKAVEILNNICAGHSFIILMKNCFPINVLSKIKSCDEVVRIFCASANPLTILTAEAKGGNAIIGVADGIAPKGVENENDKKVRRDFLKKIGYKF